MSHILCSPGSDPEAELPARDMSANRLALALRVPSGRLTDILNGKHLVSLHRHGIHLGLPRIRHTLVERHPGRAG